MFVLALLHEVDPQFPEKLCCLVLFKKNYPLLSLRNVVENGENLKEMLAFLRILVDPVEKNPRKFFVLVQSLRFNNIDGYFGC